MSDHQYKTLAELVGKAFPPLDIEHASKQELFSYRMIGLTADEEQQMFKRAEKLGLLGKSK
ncbi:hypothetical protein MUDAN_BIHEEGNE_02584 [Lactiplantibacillus mudanjiangensis]|uniref:hypothetical protein n=1 Tax=Lactiplantibacillus mudanjiangensis TaxID=1296538 RepID=UPI00101519E5|nr:hypothetical protein MUDAN_BIHEEGNE_02584 [Lactiplantibacillus mudanjiangensis]